MDKKKLYDQIAQRKFKPKDLESYDGNNGRVNRCVQLIKSGDLRRNGLLVDVGGGIGDLGCAVADLFEKTVTLDISLKNLEAASKKGNLCICADIDKDGIPSGYVAFKDGFDGSIDPQLDGNTDLVTALDFIEHIIDPENFARECYRILKPGGQVFINTPNIRFWRHILQLWIDGSFPHTSGDKEVYHGGHLAFFTFNDLCEIFGTAGFKNFTMFMDQEGYTEPPHHMILPINVSDQNKYKQLMMELGCPNLLFRCEK